MAALATTERVEGIVQEVGPIRLAKNLRMVQRAIRENWPVSDEDKAAAVNDARRTLRDPEASVRERIEASKVLLMAEGQNIKIDDQAIKLVVADERPAPGLTINGPVQINQGTPLATLLESAHVVDRIAAITQDAPKPAAAGDAGRKASPGALGAAESPPAGNGNGKH